MNTQSQEDIRRQELEKANERLQAANEELSRREKELAKVNEALRGEVEGRRKMEEELRKINSFLNSIVENIPDMIFVKEAGELKFERFNAAGEALLGFNREELIGKNDFDLFPREQAEFFVSKDREVLNQEKLMDISEEMIKTKKKGVRVLHTKKIRILNEKGQPQYLLGISEDVTDRKRTEAELWALNQQLERRVAERTAAAEERSRELAHSNAELERFASVASHDLQEPLRMVTSYVQLLERRYGDKLGPDAGEFIHFALDGANRMKGLINGLLEYSRIGRNEKPLEKTDAQAVLKMALANLKIALQEKNASITSEPLPVVMSDPVQLTAVFQNLVGNAIKFCKAPRPEVHVSAQRQNGCWMFEVRDNGIGIDPKQNQRIFEIFQQLHPSGQYPGTGLGLAICKKIVERQGGAIGVRSQPDQGATFYFSLPAADIPIVNEKQ